MSRPCVFLFPRRIKLLRGSSSNPSKTPKGGRVQVLPSTDSAYATLYENGRRFSYRCLFQTIYHMRKMFVAGSYNTEHGIGPVPSQSCALAITGFRACLLSGSATRSSIQRSSKTRRSHKKYGPFAAV